MWAQAQSDYYTNTTSTTLAEEQNRMMEDSSTPTESGTSIDLPTQDKAHYPLYPAEGETILEVLQFQL